jgi:hypothetical protein
VQLREDPSVSGKALRNTGRFCRARYLGGKYKVEKAIRQKNKEIVHCLFWPRGWSSPEPPIEYHFTIKSAKIRRWQGEYR